jgi:hypothetical protein
MTIRRRLAIAGHTRSSYAALLLLIAVVGLVVGARTFRTSASAGSRQPTLATKPVGAAQQRRPIAQMESELITITAHGFEPREIARPQGRFLLMIDNRSGLAATSLRLTREAGSRVREMPVPREEPNWSDVVDLQPGRYVLTEADHPRWSCRITISAQ